MPLTSTQRDVLETYALKAFVGKVERLGEGFLIPTDNGPWLPCTGAVPGVG